ncbi:MAG: alpha/beta hydrolase [Candidatus Heimdallarchaeaceae archaeon]
MVSRKAKLVIKLLRALPVRTMQERSVEKKRHILEKTLSVLKIPDKVSVEPTSIDEMYAEWLEPHNVNTQRVLLYLHGGAYTIGSPQTHLAFTARLSLVTSSRVLLIDYRLAPENPFPAAVEDAVRAYLWLIKEHKIKPENIIVMGDSAGGGLTIATLLKLKQEGITLPAAAICISPWVDLALTGESIITRAEEDPQLAKADLQFAAEMYLQGEDPRNPLASPLYADLSGLPPLFIQVGTAEILLDDSTRIAKKAREAGVDVTLDIWDEMIHCFTLFGKLIPESKKALDNINYFIQNL